MVQVEENQTEIIGRVGHPKGSGQFTVEVPSNIVDQASDDSTTTEVLVQLGRSMNNSRKTKTWVKRGSYCYLEMFEDAKTKVCGEMTSILSSSDEKTLRKTDKWPKAFSITHTQAPSADNAHQEDNDDDLFVNPNRRTVVEESEDSEEESD